MLLREKIHDMYRLAYQLSWFMNSMHSNNLTKRCTKMYTVATTVLVGVSNPANLYNLVLITLFVPPLYAPSFYTRGIKMPIFSNPGLLHLPVPST